MRAIVPVVFLCLQSAACEEEVEPRQLYPGQRFELVESTLVETSCPEGAPFYLSEVYNLDLHHPIGKAPNQVILSTVDQDILWQPAIDPALPPHTWRPGLQAEGWPPYDWPSEDWASRNDARSDDGELTGATRRVAMVLTQGESTVSMDYVWDLFECDHWSKCVPWGEDTCRLTMRYDFEYTGELADNIVSE